jgi:hypothetical protein
MVTAERSGPHRYLLPSTSLARRVAVLMLFEAASLAVASALHLSGQVHGRSAPFDADHAGVAEAIIGVVLGAAAVIMIRAPRRARTVGIAATGFAIAGFLVGLSMTASGGDLPDIAYHLTVLPLLVGGLLLLIRAGGSSRSA